MIARSYVPLHGESLPLPLLQQGLATGRRSVAAVVDLRRLCFDVFFLTQLAFISLRNAFPPLLDANGG
jgi:hypothetical protein